jgi:hypothetical protein
VRRRTGSGSRRLVKPLCRLSASGESKKVVQNRKLRISKKVLLVLQKKYNFAEN